MVVEGSVSYSELSVFGCGLCDSGVFMGEQIVCLVVYLVEQMMLGWKCEFGVVVYLFVELLLLLFELCVLLECDGQLLDLCYWQQGFVQIDK